MEGMVKGLFGGGDGDDQKVNQAKDFARRYTEGHPAEGYDDDEALQQFNSVIGGANEEEVERATRATLQNMPEGDRAQFGDFVSQLQQRERGGAGGSSGGGSLGVDDISKMFGQQGGKANNAQDMFGGLLRGGSGGSSDGGGGIGDMLGGLLGGGSGGSSGGGGGLGGLLGGGGGSSNQSSGGGLGGMLGGSMGKMIMGGIAAYLIKDKLR